MHSSVVIDKRSLFVFEPQTVSVDFSGSGNDRLANLTDQTIGIADDWAISAWVKNAQSATQFILDLRRQEVGEDQFSGLSIQATTGSVGRQLRTVWKDASGTPQGDTLYNAFLIIGDWKHVLVTWNGSDLNVYRDGVLDAPDSGSETPTLTMADPGRGISIGNRAQASSNVFNGRIMQVAIWRNHEVEDAISDIYNGGAPSAIDLNSSFGSYTFADDLAHWWRLGQDADDIGKDYAEAGFTPTISLNDDAIGIDAGDIVSDIPL